MKPLTEISIPKQLVSALELRTHTRSPTRNFWPPPPRAALIPFSFLCPASPARPEYDISYDELNGPCADYQPGEDDLQAFDFIRKFRLDVLEQSYPGVTSVQGSNEMQKAYRLQSSANLQIATRCVPSPPAAPPAGVGVTGARGGKGGHRCQRDKGRKEVG